MLTLYFVLAVGAHIRAHDRVAPSRPAAGMDGRRGNSLTASTAAAAGWRRLRTGWSRRSGRPRRPGLFRPWRSGGSRSTRWPWRACRSSGRSGRTDGSGRSRRPYRSWGSDRPGRSGRSRRADGSRGTRRPDGSGRADRSRRPRCADRSGRSRCSDGSGCADRSRRAGCPDRAGCSRRPRWSRRPRRSWRSRRTWRLRREPDDRSLREGISRCSRGCHPGGSDDAAHNQAGHARADRA